MGALWSQTFPPKPKFSVDDIPDLSGQVIIVTGGNTGIGKETVKALLAHNAKVYIAARSASRVSQAIDELKKVTGREAHFLELDLADLRSVKRAAEEFTRKENELHVLFNNGGVMSPPIDQLTAQGYDLQFGTNVLGHFYFTQLLLPTLVATVSTSGSPVRVINTSSSAAEGWDKDSVDYTTLTDGAARRKVGALKLYWQSKFANIVFSSELQRRYGDKGVVSVALNPGNLNTELTRHWPALMRRIAAATLLYPPAYGALTQLWAGTAAEGTNFGGKYLYPWARLGKAPPAAERSDGGEELWRWCEEQVATVSYSRF